MYKTNFKIIVLIGFRASGKSTIGKLLASNLGWDLIETDRLIIDQTGQTIDELTAGGIDWYKFRQLEHEILKSILKREKTVISSGGGMFVNRVLKKGENKTFGKLNIGLLASQKSVLRVLLTADESFIKKRIVDGEQQRPGTLRPILDESKARRSKNMSKKVLIKGIVDDSLRIFRQRQPEYLKLADLIVDTGVITPHQAVEKVLLMSYNVKL